MNSTQARTEPAHPPTLCPARRGGEPREAAIRLSRRPRWPVALLLAWLAGIAFSSAEAPWRPPNMEKELFDEKNVELNKFMREATAGRLLDLAANFDAKDEVDYELRAHALAIAGRIGRKDRFREDFEIVLDDLNERGRTTGRDPDPDKLRTAELLYTQGVQKLGDNLDSKKCAAYTADIALRLAPEGEHAQELRKTLEALTREGIEADWTGMLGEARRFSPAGKQQFGTFEVRMPGGPAEAFARNQASGIHGLVVRQLPNGAQAGAAPRMNATALPAAGLDGVLFTFNQPVGPLMGGSLQEVVKFLRVRYAEQDGKIPDGYRVELFFPNKFQAKDGPSAATGFALLLDSLFSGHELDPHFAITGDMTNDGMVQPIGGVAAKVRAALREGCTTIGIPERNANGVEDMVVLLGGVEGLLDAQIFTLRRFEEAHELSRTPAARPKRVQDAMEAFRNVVAEIRKRDSLDAALRHPAVRKKLTAILDPGTGMPNHLSARLLLDQSEGKGPQRLSARGTKDEIEIQMASVHWHTRAGRGAQGTEVDLGETIEALEDLGPMIDPRFEEYHQANLALARLLESGRDRQGSDEEFLSRIREAHGAIQNAQFRLSTDTSIAEDLMN